MSLYFNTSSSVFNSDSYLTGLIEETANPIRPAYSSNISYTPAMLITQFGDGYRQRAEDGINNMPRKFKLKFSLMRTFATALLKFLKGSGGCPSNLTLYDRGLNEPFLWTPPEPDNVQGKFTCTEFDFVWNSWEDNQFNCIFVEEFDA